jgi:hypothetical protein
VGRLTVLSQLGQQDEAETLVDNLAVEFRYAARVPMRMQRERLVSLAESAPPVLKSLFHLEFSQLASEEGQLDDALQWALRAHRESPDMASASRRLLSLTLRVASPPAIEEALERDLEHLRVLLNRPSLSSEVGPATLPGSVGASTAQFLFLASREPEETPQALRQWARETEDSPLAAACLIEAGRRLEAAESHNRRAGADDYRAAWRLLPDDPALLMTVARSLESLDEPELVQRLLQAKGASNLARFLIAQSLPEAPKRQLLRDILRSDANYLPLNGYVSHGHAALG